MTIRQPNRSRSQPKLPTTEPPQVGTADPERKNSPIQTDPEQSFELLREQVGDEAAGCYFNDVEYAEGALIMSGRTRLRCERGIWVEAGTEL